MNSVKPEQAGRSFLGLIIIIVGSICLILTYQQELKEEHPSAPAVQTLEQARTAYLQASADYEAALKRVIASGELGSQIASDPKLEAEFQAWLKEPKTSSRPSSRPSH